MRALLALPLLCALACGINLGRRGGGPDGGGAPDAGAAVPDVLASGLDCPLSLALDATHAYVLTYGGSSSTYGSLQRVPRAGGPVETLAVGQMAPGQLALTDTEVWWTTGGSSPSRFDGAIRHTAKTPAAPPGAGDVVASAYSPGGIRVDASGNVYWVDHGLLKLSPGATAPTTLFSGPVSPALAIDTANAYIGPNDGQNQILQVSLSGHQQKTLVAAAQLPGGGGGFYVAADIALDDTYVYWITNGATFNGNRLLRAAKRGNAPAQVLAAYLNSPSSLAVDGKYVYFSDNDQILYVPKDGSGPVQTLAADPGSQAAGRYVPLVIDGDFLYWAFCVPGELRAAPRPQ